MKISFRNKTKLLKYLLLLIVGIILLCLPLIASSYMLHIMIIVFLYVCLASSWNLIICSGQLSLGHNAFFGIGAYSGAILYAFFSLPPIFVIILSGIISMIVGAGLGYVCLRLRGAYLAIVTLVFAEILRVITLMFPNITGGGEGFILPPLFEGSINLYYYSAMLLSIITIYTSYKVLNSKLGMAFTAIREDEDAAEASGINTTLYKIISFTIGCIFPGLVGAFYAFYVTFITPYDVFGRPMAVISQTAPIFGGLYTFIGPIIGGSLLAIISEILRVSLGPAHTFLYGLTVVIIILYAPEGIWGLVKRSMKQR